VEKGGKITERQSEVEEVGREKRNWVKLREGRGKSDRVK
jgi:hypothetical protein